MIVGIDVGGTNTDIAYLEDGVLKTMKYPNEYGIVRILEEVSKEVNLKDSKLIISTSLPINLISSRFDRIKTLTLLFPGPGLNYKEHGVVLKGCVNHRGEIVEDVDENEIKRVLRSHEYDCIAIVGKFSVRNPYIEHRVFEIARSFVDPHAIALSHHIGKLNFLLRLNTTVINSKIAREIWMLTESIRKFTDRFFYYKGDGGIIPWRIAMMNPSELYNSSPSSVAFGAHYLTGEKDAIVIDIGGTTTDLTLIKDGKPVVVEDVRVCGLRTHIRCVNSISIPYGGDSLFDGELKPFRLDKPLAFGGKHPTLTDLLNVLGEEIGNYKASRDGIGLDIAEKEVDRYIEMLAEKVEGFQVDTVIGTGYLASYLIPEVARRAGKRCIIPENHQSANAVGVAVSRISLTLYARFDTEKRMAIFNGEIEGEHYEPLNKNLDDEEIVEMCMEKARDLAIRYGADEKDVREVDVVYFNSYSVVRGGIMRGKIADVVVQIKPGLSVDL